MTVGRACAQYKQWISRDAPKLGETFPAKILADLPRMLGRESARRWLTSRGVDAAQLTPDVLDRLREMAADAATPAAQLFPAHTKIHRRHGWITRE